MTWGTHSHTDGFLAEFCTLHPGTAANSAVVLDTAVSQQRGVLYAPVRSVPEAGIRHADCMRWASLSDPFQCSAVGHCLPVLETLDVASLELCSTRTTLPRADRARPTRLRTVLSPGPLSIAAHMVAAMVTVSWARYSGRRSAAPATSQSNIRAAVCQQLRCADADSDSVDGQAVANDTSWIIWRSSGFRLPGKLRPVCARAHSPQVTQQAHSPFCPQTMRGPQHQKVAAVPHPGTSAGTADRLRHMYFGATAGGQQQTAAGAHGVGRRTVPGGPTDQAMTPLQSRIAGIRQALEHGLPSEGAVGFVCGQLFQLEQQVTDLER